MNNNLKTMILAGLAASALVAGSASAADATVGLDLNSAYVWRGITFNDSFVAQPSLDVAGPGGLGLNVWGNFDLDDYVVGEETLVESGDFSEVDLTISYVIPEEIENADFGIGLIEYLFPGADGSTREVYGEVGVDLGHGFGAGLFLTYDFDEVDDFYGNVSLAYDYPLYEELTVTVEGLLGYAGSDFASGDSSGLHEYQITLSAAYAASEFTEIGAFLAYTEAADSDVLADVDVDFLGGISAYYSY